MTRLKLFQMPMNETYIFKIKALFCFSFILLTSNQAKSSELTKGTVANISYTQNRINIAGLNQSNHLKLSGLEAEIISRRNGVDSLREQLLKTCQESDLETAWQDRIRSLGSEIFADHTFKILLAGNLSDVLKPNTQSADLVTADNKPIVFRLPAQIPLASTDCGKLTLQLPDTNTIKVFPTRTSQNSTRSAEIIVSLALSKSNGVLVASNKSDLEIISQSNLSTIATSFQAKILALPIKP